MSSVTLPNLILSVVACHREQRPKTVVEQIRLLLQGQLASVRNSMHRSKPKLIKRMSKRLYWLYKNGTLANFLFQAAHDGKYSDRERLEKMATILRTHLNGIMQALRQVTYTAILGKLSRLIAVSPAPSISEAFATALAKAKA